MRKRRDLTGEDRALWEKVARTARPLDPHAAPPPAVDEPPKGAAKPKRAAAPIVLPAPPPVPRAPSAPVAIDRRTRSKLARGLAEIDGRIDLHGLTLERARGRLLSYLSDRHRGDARIVLVITGKGSGAGGEGRGVIRREVPLWLASPDFRPLVSGYSAAHRTHGGEGALYVRLRKKQRIGSSE